MEDKRLTFSGFQFSSARVFGIRNVIDYFQ